MGSWCVAPVILLSAGLAGAAPGAPGACARRLPRPKRRNSLARSIARLAIGDLRAIEPHG